MTGDKAVCSGCGKEIIWIKNENGKSEPFDWKPCRVLCDVGPNAVGQRVYEIKTQAHLPHFVTCKKADDFRKPKGENQ